MITQPIKNRHRVPEIMDQPGLNAAEHTQALRGLGRINHISRSGFYLWRKIEQLSRENPGRRIRVLDLACGGGDVVRQLATRAFRAKLNIQVDGADVSETAITHAREQMRSSGLNSRFMVLDALRNSLPEDFDVLTCTLFLHHLDEPDAVALLCRMRQAAGQLVLVDDLVRSSWGYFLASVGCRLLSRSRVVHFDGPASVAGAFTVAEVRSLAEKAGLSDARLERHWPERFLLSWRRTQ